MEADLKVLNNKEIKSNAFIEKLNEMENTMKQKDEKIDTLHREMENVCSIISDQKKKIDSLVSEMNLLRTKTIEDEIEKDPNDLIANCIDASKISDPEDELKVKCTMCEYATTSDEELKVHTAEKHSVSLICEICDFKAVNKSIIQIHLVTCELYRCSKCDFKSRRLSQVKTHTKKIAWIW